VAAISRPFKIPGLFCKRALQKRLYSAKETDDFKERTNQRSLINSGSFAERVAGLFLVKEETCNLRLPEQDAQDALSCRSLSAKEPYKRGLFCRKRPAT